MSTAPDFKYTTSEELEDAMNPGISAGIDMCWEVGYLREMVRLLKKEKQELKDYLNRAPCMPRTPHKNVKCTVYGDRQCFDCGKTLCYACDKDYVYTGK